MSSLFTRLKPIELQRWLTAVIIVWMVILVLFPSHEHGVGRDLYRVVHYGLLPLFFGIIVLSNKAKLKERFWLHIGWIDWAMLSYLVFVLVSVVSNDALQEGPIPHVISIYRRIFVAFVAFWVVRLVRPGEKELRRLVPVMVILCIIECTAGLIAWFRPEMLSSIWPGRVAEFGGPRITGTFTQADVYSGALVFFSTFIFQFAFTRKKSVSRLIYFALFDLAMVSIFFSYSRASWLAAMTVLIVLACLYTRSFLLFVLPGLVMWGSLLMVVDGQENSYAVKRLNTSDTVRSRIITNMAGLKMFGEKPIFGWGYGSYDLHDWKFMKQIGSFKPTTWEKEEATSHNTYLTILAETGIMGFLLYTVPLWWWFILTVRAWPRLPKGLPAEGFAGWRFFLMLWANLLFILLISQAIDIRFFPFILVQMWFVLGLIANTVEACTAPDDRALSV